MIAFIATVNPPHNKVLIQKLKAGICYLTLLGSRRIALHKVSSSSLQAG